MTAQMTPAPAAAAALPAAGVGPKLTTPPHFVALRAVRDGAVVCHPPASHHIPGWGWAGGGDVTLAYQDALSDLHSMRLIVVDRSGRYHVDGDPVLVTEAGRIVLDRMGDNA